MFIVYFLQVTLKRWKRHPKLKDETEKFELNHFDQLIIELKENVVKKPLCNIFHNELLGSEICK